MSPPFLGELCGAATLRVGAEERVLAGPGPHPQTGLWFWGLGGASFTASVGRILRAAVAEMRNPSQIARFLWARALREPRAPGRLGKAEQDPKRPRGACNNAPVSRGPHVARDSLLAPFRPLGASQSDEADLSPISPELALVDPVLAERARTLLPEPWERPRLQQTQATAERSRTPVVQRPAPAPGRRLPIARWKRTVALSALVFVAGAASGGFLGRREPPSRPVLLEGGFDTPNATVTEESTQSAAQQTSTHTRQATQGRRDSRSNESIGGKDRRRRAPVTWAANVLGVTAAVDARAVRLVWQSPPRSDHVVVFRTADNSKQGFIVFRGRATSVRDVPPRLCTHTATRSSATTAPATGQPVSRLPS